MGFPEFTIYHMLQWDFRFIILEVTIINKDDFQTFPIDDWFVKEAY